MFIYIIILESSKKKYYLCANFSYNNCLCRAVSLSHFNQLLEVARYFLHVNGKLLILSLLAKYLSFLLHFALSLYI